MEAFHQSVYANYLYSPVPEVSSSTAGQAKSTSYVCEQHNNHYTCKMLETSVRFALGKILMTQLFQRPERDILNREQFEILQR